MNESKESVAKLAARSAMPPMIYEALHKVMNEVEAIGKDRTNQQQGFKFRGIDQVYNALHPLMAKHGIVTVPRVRSVLDRSEHRSNRGSAIFRTMLEVEYDFVAADGSKITVGPVIGEAMDTGDKGCNKAMAIAHKYILFQLFMIPTEDQADDPDFEAYSVAMDTMEAAMAGGPPPQEFTDPGWDQSPTETPSMAEALDADGARDVADQFIALAGMHGSSIQALADFWRKNKQMIDYLDTHFNDEYQRVKHAFTTIKRRLGEPK